MGDVGQNIGANLVRDFADFCKINGAWDGGTAGDDQFGFVFLGQGAHLVIVDQVVLLTYAVLDCIEPFAGLVWCGAMCQVSTGIQRHAQNGFTWLHQCLENALVCLAARIGLNVCE